MRQFAMMIFSTIKCCNIVLNASNIARLCCAKNCRCELFLMTYLNNAQNGQVQLSSLQCPFENYVWTLTMHFSILFNFSNNSEFSGNGF